MFDVKETQNTAIRYNMLELILFQVVADKSHSDFGREREHFYMAINVPV